MSDMADTLRHSVTKNDYAASPWQGNFLFVYPDGLGLYGATYTPLPPWWSLSRDFALRRTLQMESLWAGAVAKAISRIAALGWELEDTSQQRISRYQSLYLNAVASRRRGWVPFVQAHLRDYLLTDNGAFIEVIRASSAAASRIVGLAHLDSARCTRTADPEIPVLYRDRLGAYHEMRAHQVLTFVDMPDPSETWNGVGLCAASRAYVTIASFAALRQYLYEKSSGDGATEITFIQGMAEQTLTSAIRSADNAQKAKGAVFYKGKILSAFQSDTPLNEVTVPLKNVPDGFDFQQELTFTQRIYALCIGLPEQAIAPLSGQGLGTGTQTMILDDAAEGEGLAAWMQLWTHTQNEEVLPTATTFAWSNRHDTRDKKAQADLKAAQANTIKTLVADAGIIEPVQGLQLAVDWETVPKEFIPVDATPAPDLADDEKPAEDATAEAAQLQQALAATPPPPGPQKPAATTKEARIDAALSAAVALVEEVLRHAETAQ